VSAAKQIRTGRTSPALGLRAAEAGPRHCIAEDIGVGRIGKKPA
jgi:hypothetical protein